MDDIDLEEHAHRWHQKYKNDVSQSAEDVSALEPVKISIEAPQRFDSKSRERWRGGGGTLRW